MQLLVSTRKGLVIFRKHSGKWKPDRVHFDGIPVSLSYYDPIRHQLWAFQDHGHWGMKIQRSLNFGESWEELPAPVYPEGSMVKPGVPASLKYIWAAQHLMGSHPHDFLVGTEPGGLFHWSEDRKDWTLNTHLWNQPGRADKWFGGGRDFPGIHSIVIDPRDPTHWYVGISCAGVFESHDAGATWHPRNNGLRADFLPDPKAEIGHDPHLLMCCENHPEVMWQQNHCGIFKSNDAGKNWIDVSEPDGPAFFGFAIAAHETNPDVAWVAPGVSDEKRVAIDHALCISRTEDGGKTWQALRTGLPQEYCFDIVYRHALISRQDQLVFGTTTGNLFHSDDGGDSWQTLSNHLPMVYATAFAEQD